MAPSSPDARRWWPAAVAALLLPKCIFCLGGYLLAGGLVAGPELCGPQAGAGHLSESAGWLAGLVGLGGVVFFRAWIPGKEQAAAGSNSHCP
jgi:alpha-glucuronidase